MYFFLKVLISALIIGAVSEAAKRDVPLASVVASLPLTSVLAILWLYHDTRNSELAGTLATQIFWAILPSLLFFLTFPWLIRTGMRFSLSLTLSLGIMVIGYLLYMGAIRRLGIGL